VYDFTRPVFGENVVYDASKKNRMVQMQTMANGLRASRLKQYVPKIEEETRKYLKQHWGEGGTVDLLTALSELTILTASRCLHGEDTRGHIFKELQALYHDLDHGLTPISVFWPDAPTQAHRKRNAARKEMTKLFTKVIRERRQNPDKSDGTDILGLFMDIKYKDGKMITEDEVTGLLIALLFVRIKHNSSNNFVRALLPSCVCIAPWANALILTLVRRDSTRAASPRRGRRCSSPTTRPL
jgi:sterol 14alpha-demethylase